MENQDINTKARLFGILRSKGYCLPYMGKDPIIEGWAILETINQPQG